ncbi:MAG: PIN domain-containing protein, partial [Dehalococcoidia bacterium]
GSREVWIAGWHRLSGFLDTSVVVRYITGDLEGLAQAATDIVDGEQELWITDVVLAEASYVLSSVYQLSRALIVDQLIEFVQKQNIIVYAISKGLLIQALLMCRPSGRVSVADALIWAAARSSGSGVVYSFDQRFPDEGLEVRSSATGP